MPQQEQFLNVIDRDEAERRFHAALELQPLGHELIPLSELLGRVLACNVTAEIDVPGFDRSNFDGFAVRADDTHAAREESPRRLRLLDVPLIPGQARDVEVAPGTAACIATGAILPRGADAVVMVEHADIDSGQVSVIRPVAAGDGVSFAGSDIAAGELILRRGELLTSRETGVLAALGVAQASVWRRPRVAILSTGDELVAPGGCLHTGQIFDSNARVLADAVRELGAMPVACGIVPDDLQALRQQATAALAANDVLLLSGGTSKGAGDLSYRVIQQLGSPGIVAHGVALKPGKPICLAVADGKPVVVLPGFPTSAIFTFHEFVAPVIRALGGRPLEQRATVEARLAVRVLSEPGRTEYLLVGLVVGPQGLVAYPMGKGSGSITTFARADGFVTIGQHHERVDADTRVTVHRLSRDSQPADLVAIGSHCIGLDYLLGELQSLGVRTKFMAVGSTGGLRAAERGECDLAGIHLLDPQTGQYNKPFVGPGLALLHGYRRRQGILFRPGDSRFENRSPHEAVAAAVADPGCSMVNRNQGSGTRILIDQLLAGATPAGYSLQSKNHNAVAVAIAQGRADWGVAIEFVARHHQLGFIHLADEQYDFVVPANHRQRPAVRTFEQLLADPRVSVHLASLGLLR